MSRRTPGEIAEELRHVLSTVARRARAERAPGESDAQVSALSYPLRAMLRRIELEGSATTAELARAEQITPQTAGALVATLEAAALVVRRQDATDGRRRPVTLTAAGRRRIAAGRSETRSWLEQRIAVQLDAGEQQTLIAALALLRKVVEA